MFNASLLLSIACINPIVPHALPINCLKKYTSFWSFFTSPMDVASDWKRKTYCKLPCLYNNANGQSDDWIGYLCETQLHVSFDAGNKIYRLCTSKGFFLKYHYFIVHTEAVKRLFVNKWSHDSNCNEMQVHRFFSSYIFRNR